MPNEDQKDKMLNYTNYLERKEEKKFTILTQVETH